MNPRNSRTRQRKARNKHNRRGMTLTEAVVSLFLFALFIACACELTVVTRQASDRARFRYHAINLARNRLERALTFDYDQSELCVTDKLVVDRHGSPTSLGDYRMSTAVTQVGTNVKMLTVRVDIRDRRSMAFDGESQILTSYMTPFGEAPDA